MFGKTDLISNLVGANSHYQALSLLLHNSYQFERALHHIYIKFLVQHHYLFRYA